MVSASLSPSVGQDHSTGEVGFETDVLPNDHHFWEQEGLSWGLAVV